VITGRNRACYRCSRHAKQLGVDLHLQIHLRSQNEHSRPNGSLKVETTPHTQVYQARQSSMPARLRQGCSSALAWCTSKCLRPSDALAPLNCMTCIKAACWT
jgi:hypothetical protein